MGITLPPRHAEIGLLMFGIDCHFTTEVLKAVLRADLSVVGLVLPGIPGSPAPIEVPTPRRSVPLAGAQEIDAGLPGVSRKHGIPVYRFGSLTSQAATAALASFKATLLVCACFPQLIPRRVTRLFPDGAFNIHPSFLPALRGPDPMFWTFRDGSGQSGVTIHHLSPEFDAGPIVDQRSVQYHDGTSEPELETRLASCAADMLASTVAEIRAGQEPQRVEQDHSLATYAPFPTQDDFHLDRSMPARHAFNFVRGVQHRQIPITVELDGARVRIVHAIRYRAWDDEPERDPSTVAIPFRDGFLDCLVAPVDIPD